MRGIYGWYETPKFSENTENGEVRRRNPPLPIQRGDAEEIFSEGLPMINLFGLERIRGAGGVAFIARNLRDVLRELGKS